MMSLEANRNQQQELLIALLQHAYQNVPYYRDVLEQAGVVRAGGAVNLDAWSAVPALTRPMLNEQQASLISHDHLGRKSFVNHSGGSTGQPVAFMQDNAFWRGSMAGMWMSFAAVTPFPCPYVQLWGSGRDHTNRIRQWLWGKTLLNAFKMSEADMRKYVQVINAKRPKIIEAYVQAIYELAQFIKGHDLSVYSPDGIITSAGTLYPEMRVLIEDVFQTKVLNRYGSREAGTIAYECMYQKGLHVNILQYVVEILDETMTPCLPGQTGQVYITTLTNYSMPLIRYQMGDLATISDREECICGRGLPLIQQVEGRETSMLHKRDGSVVPAEYFIHFLGVVLNKGDIIRFQVIQKEFEHIEIKVVVRDEAGFSDQQQQLENAVRDVMGSACKVTWNFVADIPSLENGKYEYVRREF